MADHPSGAGREDAGPAAGPPRLEDLPIFELRARSQEGMLVKYQLIARVGGRQIVVGSRLLREGEDQDWDNVQDYAIGVALFWERDAMLVRAREVAGNRYSYRPDHFADRWYASRDGGLTWQETYDEAEGEPIVRLSQGGVNGWDPEKD